MSVITDVTSFLTEKIVPHGLYQTLQDIGGKAWGQIMIFCFKKFREDKNNNGISDILEFLTIVVPETIVRFIDGIQKSGNAIFLQYLVDSGNCKTEDTETVSNALDTSLLEALKRIPVVEPK